MHTAIKVASFTVISLLLGSTNFAQAHAAEEPTQTRNELARVYVSSSVSSIQMTYWKYILAQRAMEKNKNLAPNAKLAFIAYQKGAFENPIKLRLESEEEYYNISINDDKSFSLPDISTKNPKESFLVANRPSKNFAITPHPRTPDLPANSYRMGDLRLQCEVQMAMAAEEIPVILRAGLFLAGGICRSSKIYYSTLTPIPSRSASIKYAGKFIPIKISIDGNSWSPPLSDSSIPNDALIVIEPLASIDTLKVGTEGS